MSSAVVEPSESTSPDRDEIWESVRRILPRIEERADQVEEQRQVSLETMDELREAGLFRVMQPLEYGGCPIPTVDYCDIILEMARRCASTGWVYRLLSSHARLIATFGPQASADVWETNHDAIACSAYALTGVATPTEGGFHLSGTFPFSSGCDHADWAILGGRVQAPGRETDGQSRFFLVPIGDVEIVDDWYALGLKGSGSKTLVGKEVFVPAHRTLVAPFIEGGTAQHGFALIAIGVALGAVDRFVEIATGPRRGLRPQLGATESVQITVAEAVAEVDAALLILRRDLLDAEPAAGESRTLPLEIQARNRRDHGFMNKLALQAVDRLFQAAGGTMLYDSNLLQRSFRDAHAVGQHVALHWPLAFAQSGKIILGQDYQPVF